jgi:hypothetical protein
MDTMQLGSARPRLPPLLACGPSRHQTLKYPYYIAQRI